MAEDSRCDRFCNWFRGPLFLLYINYFSVTWGNRMWNFALGLFFVNIADQELRLTAIYGFVMGGSVLLLGGLVGNWVDRTNRLTAVRTSILVQKISVSICASLICFLLMFQSEITPMWGGALHYIFQGAVVVLAVLAELATMSYLRIELEKDWFVVVTEGKQSKLANLNATTRAVDLITNIVSPIVTGQIMTSVSQVIAGVTIAAWHIGAILVEMVILTRIYRTVPNMAVKSGAKTDELDHLNAMEEEEKKVLGSNGVMNGNSVHTSKELEATSGQDEGSGDNCCHTMCSPCIVLWTGWKTYARQIVVFAGLSLAFLFMTVLGFDTITTGYIYANGIPENIVGIVMASGSLAGVLGAFLYTQFRKCLGLERTGLISYSWQLGCLVLCVASIWLPGSKFQPQALWQGFTDDTQTTCSVNNSSSVIIINSSLSGDLSNEILYNSSNSNPNPSDNNTTNCFDETDSESSYVISQSIIIFLVGLTSSRIGLYLSDLVVCQLQQENVPEKERGIVNGVQNSLNNLMDMFKFISVIFLPRIETFGYLIMLSFMFIFFAVLLYCYHCFKVSQHSCINCISGKTVTRENNKITEDVVV